MGDTTPPSITYDIVTSAGFTGPVIITFKVPSVTDATTFSRLRVLHGEGGVLVDRTIRAPDSPAPNFATRTISARVNSLSPFLVAEEVDDTLPQITGLVVDEQGNPLADLSVSLPGVGETLPGHRTIKSSMSRTALTQSGISRDGFIRAYEQA